LHAVSERIASAAGTARNREGVDDDRHPPLVVLVQSNAFATAGIPTQAFFPPYILPLSAT
jgi:hypothetical protein